MKIFKCRIAFCKIIRVPLILLIYFWKRKHYLLLLTQTGREFAVVSASLSYELYQLKGAFVSKAMLRGWGQLYIAPLKCVSRTQQRTFKSNSQTSFLLLLTQQPNRRRKSVFLKSQLTEARFAFTTLYFMILCAFESISDPIIHIRAYSMFDDKL